MLTYIHMVKRSMVVTYIHSYIFPSLQNKMKKTMQHEIAGAVGSGAVVTWPTTPATLLPQSSFQEGLAGVANKHL